MQDFLICVVKLCFYVAILVFSADIVAESCILVQIFSNRGAILFTVRDFVVTVQDLCLLCEMCAKFCCYRVKCACFCLLSWYLCTKTGIL